MNPADFREEDRAFVERVQSYSEKPDAFRSRWHLRHFHFRPASWLAAVLLLVPIAWIAWSFGGLHLALKGVLAVMALIAVLPLARDFRRPQCVQCDEEADSIAARKLSGEQQLIVACHHCRAYRVEEADSSPLPL